MVRPLAGSRIICLPQHDRRRLESASMRGSRIPRAPVFDPLTSAFMPRMRKWLSDRTID